MRNRLERTRPEPVALSVAAVALVVLALAGAARTAERVAPPRQLAFTRCERGDCDLSAVYVATEDTRRIRRMTSIGANCPAWSADGRWLAYDDSGSDSIVVLGADGTGRRRVPNTSAADCARWSPDGRRFAVRLWDKDQIGIINTDGSDARLVRTPVGVWLGGIDWSPDGRRLAFTGSPANGPASIYVAELDGTRLRRVTFGQYDTRVRWSPDGVSLLFIREGRPDRLFIVRPTGGRLALVRTAPTIAGADWAPDGKRIAYTAYGHGRDGVHIFDLRRSADRWLTRLPCAPRGTRMCQDVDW